MMVYTLNKQSVKVLAQYGVQVSHEKSIKKNTFSLSEYYFWSSLSAFI